MEKASQKGIVWERYKEIDVPWSEYDNYRNNECTRVLDLCKHFRRLDRPIQRREFPLSSLATLLLIKILFNIPYRSLASMVKGFQIYELLGMKRAPCYKTLQRTMDYLDVEFLEGINRYLVPSNVDLSGIDASGLKTTRKGAWVQIRFGKQQRKRDFKKLHIFVDLRKKKILNCILTEGMASDHRQLRQLVGNNKWLKVEIVLGDKGYDTRDSFHGISDIGAVPGIRVRANASTKARGCPSRRKAVLQQKKDYDKWKKDVEYSMRCVVEAIFSATKRRFGEILFSTKNRFRAIEAWLRTIVWNITIYPR